MFRKRGIARRPVPPGRAHYYQTLVLVSVRLKRPPTRRFHVSVVGHFTFTRPACVAFARFTAAVRGESAFSARGGRLSFVGGAPRNDDLGGLGGSFWSFAPLTVGDALGELIGEALGELFGESFGDDGRARLESLAPLGLADPTLAIPERRGAAAGTGAAAAFAAADAAGSAMETDRRANCAGEPAGEGIRTDDSLRAEDGGDARGEALGEARGDGPFGSWRADSVAGALMGFVSPDTRSLLTPSRKGPLWPGACGGCFVWCLWCL